MLGVMLCICTVVRMHLLTKVRKLPRYPDVPGTYVVGTTDIYAWYEYHLMVYMYRKKLPALLSLYAPGIMTPVTCHVPGTLFFVARGIIICAFG